MSRYKVMSGEVMGQTVLGIDLEGMNKNLLEQGVDIKTDRVIEIGAVLWDWEFHQPVRIMSELVNESDRLPMTEEVIQLTGINEDVLERYALKGDEIKPVLERLAKLMESADYLMAHNAKGYDQPMLEGMFKRYDIKIPDTIWIDTLTDLEFPSKIKQKSLAMLEYSHGFINPFPHRAVTDVLSMLKIASQYSLSRMGKLAESPIVQVVAQLQAPNWSDKKEVAEFNKIKHKVAKNRFKWNPSNKTWSKEIQKVLIDEGKINFEFDWFIRD